jgi:uncharacterized protein YkwD
VLIKDHQTAKMNPLLSKNPDIKQSKISREKPKEGLAMLIGKKLSALEKQLGKPQRIDQSNYGYEWYIYNQDYTRYLQVGVEDNRVVTVYAIGDNLDVAPFEIGQPVEEIYNTQYIDANIDINLKGNTFRFELNDTDLNIRPIVQLGDIYVQLYIDKFTGNLSSIRFLDAKTFIKLKPYELTYSGQLEEPPPLTDSMLRTVEAGTAKQVFDITNVLRLRNNVKPLIWDEETAKAAFDHSKDMAENNDYSTTSKKFGSLSDRLKAANIPNNAADENIAADYSDAPAVVEGWINSQAHRDKLLSNEFSNLGVGVYQKYYTEDFIQKPEQ